MADQKISALTAASTPLAGTEVLPIVQSGSTVKVAVSNLTAGRDVSATSIAAGLGLVGTPAYTFTGDTNTGMWSPAADTVAVSTAGAERIRISSAGFVGIGVNVPGSILDVRTAAGSGSFLVLVNTSATANTNVIETSYTLSNASTGSATAAVIGATNPFAAGNTYGDIYFKTTNPTLGLTEKMRIDSAGDITAKTGNIIVGTANKGIDFSANANAPGMTSELLNWYEEGTWTPTLASESGAFGAITYNALNGGRYIRVGKVVHIQAILYTDSVAAGTASLEVRVAGLPFTAVASSGSTQNGFSSLAVAQSSNWITNQPSAALVRANSTQIGLFHRLTANGASVNTTVSDVTTGSTGNLLRFSGTYFCA